MNFHTETFGTRIRQGLDRRYNYVVLLSGHQVSEYARVAAEKVTVNVSTFLGVKCLCPTLTRLEFEEWEFDFIWIFGLKEENGRPFPLLTYK